MSRLENKFFGNILLRGGNILIAFVLDSTGIIFGCNVVTRDDQELFLCTADVRGQAVGATSLLAAGTQQA